MSPRSDIREVVKETVRRVVTDFTCGFCFSHSGYEIISTECLWRCDDLWKGGVVAEGRAFVVVKCQNCALPNLFIFDVYDDDFAFSVDEWFSPEFYRAENPGIILVEWDPSERMVWGCTGIAFLGQYPYGYKFSECIPETLVCDLQEAGNCLAVGAANACVAMCRRVIERLAKSLNIEPDSNLCNTLKKLRDSGYIDQSLYEALYEIKQWGNIGAHADSDAVGLKEAKAILGLVTRTVEYVYLKEEIETEAAKLRQRRLQAKATQ